MACVALFENRGEVLLEGDCPSSAAAGLLAIVEECNPAMEGFRKVSGDLDTYMMIGTKDSKGVFDVDLRSLIPDKNAREAPLLV